MGAGGGGPRHWIPGDVSRGMGISVVSAGASIARDERGVR
jgi:hypothetical protein